MAVGAPGWDIVASPDPAHVLTVRAVAMWAAAHHGVRVPQIEALAAGAEDSDE